MVVKRNRVLALPGPGSHFRLRRFLAPALLFIFLAGWWLAFGPAVLGGPATFAIVDGRSMEPSYNYGDLVVARKAPGYEAGDVVVFPSTNGRVIIHRIVDGNAIDGWRTRGDNNDSDDRWILPNDGILGKKWFSVPEVGHALLWTQRHPWIFASGIGVLVLMLSALSGRPNRLHPYLEHGVSAGRRVLPWESRPLAEVLAGITAGVAAIASLVSLIVLWSVGIVDSPAGLVMGLVFVVSGISAKFFSRRLLDGRSSPEPIRSRVILSDECRVVEELPEVDPMIVCISPFDLREYLGKNRLPVLRRDNADGSSSFLTIAKNGRAYTWQTPTRHAKKDGVALRVRTPHEAP